MTREVSVKELEAARRSPAQELGDLTKQGEGTTRTDGIPIVGPLQYPAGPKPCGKGGKKPQAAGEAAVQTPTFGGKPPGLSLPAASNQETDAIAKKKTRMRKDPPPRLTEKQLECVSRARDICSMMESPSGNRHLSDNLFFRRGGYGVR